MADETLGPLPAGRHGQSREQVAHHQRELLIAGLATAVAEHGYACHHHPHSPRPPRSPVASSTRTSRARRSASSPPSTWSSATSLEDLLPDFAEFILSPYLGPEQASQLAREAA